MEIELKYPFNQKNYRHKLTRDVIIKIKNNMNRQRFNRIRNEIRLRKLDLIANGENENNALNIARKEANDKYGKGWREKLLINMSSASKIKEPTTYDEHQFGEHWMD